MLLCSSGSDGRYVLVQASAGDCPRSFLVRILLFRISGEIFKTQCQFILHGWRNGCVLLDFMASYCCAFCSVTGKVPSKIAIATSKTLDDVTATLKALIMSNRRIAFFYDTFGAIMCVSLRSTFNMRCAQEAEIGNE